MVLDVIVTSITLISSQTSGNHVLRERFINECPAALARLEGYFSRKQGVARSTTIGGKSEGVRSVPIEFATDGPNKMVRYTRNFSAKGQSQTVRFVLCLAGSKSFNLRAAGDGPYRITSVGDDEAAIGGFDAAFGNYLDASWKVYFMLGRINPREEFQAERHSRGVRGQRHARRGRIPSRPYHRESTDPLSSGLQSRQRLVDRRVGSPPGSPLSSRIMRVDYGADRSSPATYPVRISMKDFDDKESIHEFDRVDFGPVDHKVFQIETYGLSDISQALPGRSSRLTWVFAAAGAVVALLVGAWILKRAADRRR